MRQLIAVIPMLLLSDKAEARDVVAVVDSREMGREGRREDE